MIYFFTVSNLPFSCHIINMLYTLMSKNTFNIFSSNYSSTHNKDTVVVAAVYLLHANYYAEKTIYIEIVPHSDNTHYWAWALQVEIVVSVKLCTYRYLV